MKEQDDYIAGSSHTRTHFWCGLVFGAAIGGLIGLRMFDAVWHAVLAASLIALLIAASCARWGDRAWRSIIGFLASLR